MTRHELAAMLAGKRDRPRRPTHAAPVDARGAAPRRLQRSDAGEPAHLRAVRRPRAARSGLHGGRSVGGAGAPLVHDAWPGITARLRVVVGPPGRAGASCAGGGGVGALVVRAGRRHVLVRRAGPGRAPARASTSCSATTRRSSRTPRRAACCRPTRCRSRCRDHSTASPTCCSATAVLLGHWRVHRLPRGEAEIETRLARAIDEREQAALDTAVGRYEQFTRT